MYSLSYMSVDLFSSLDGCFSFTSWLPTLILPSFFLMNFGWVTHSSSWITKAPSSLWSHLSSKFFLLKLILTSLIILLISNNIVGLTPYSYGTTSSLWINGTLALTLWGLLFISGWFYSPSKSAANLTPNGAPLILTPLLILIESVSLLIRPLTLTVRLMANMSAGHIVLSLLSSVLSSSISSLSMTILISLSIGYYLFEVFVCMIQAYIFSLLISLYAFEHPFSF